MLAHPVCTRPCCFDILRRYIMSTGWSKKHMPLATVSQKVSYTSQGSVATRLRCGGIFNEDYYQFNDIAESAVVN